MRSIHAGNTVVDLHPTTIASFIKAGLIIEHDTEDGQDGDLVLDPNYDDYPSLELLFREIANIQQENAKCYKDLRQVLLSIMQYFGTQGLSQVTGDLLEDTQLQTLQTLFQSDDPRSFRANWRGMQLIEEVERIQELSLETNTWYKFTILMRKLKAGAGALVKDAKFERYGG